MIDAVLPTYNRAPLAFERGEGAWAITADGTRYLDLGAGIAVNALGHANPDLVAALTALAIRLKAPRLIEDPPPYRPGAALRGPKHLRLAIDGIAP